MGGALSRLDRLAPMRVLVSGGAGYIGSHTVVQLVAAGHDVVIVDNFANSKPTVVGRLESLTGTHLPVHSFDLLDQDKVERLFAQEPIDAVIHFAGLKSVGESVEKPLEYYENNIGSTFSLVRAMRRHNVHKLVFSSSATVYGVSEPPFTEDMPTGASNRYGWTKVMIEQILRDVALADPSWRIALLRYFNPVGAHESGTIGEDPQGVPNNLMPFVAQVAVGRREKLRIFGGDYPTPDGTALRDFIHVEDLAAGILRPSTSSARPRRLCRRGTSAPASRTSVLEVVHAFGRAAGRELPYEIVERRPGDLPCRLRRPQPRPRGARLAREADIDDMCVDSWRWQSQNPEGYPRRLRAPRQTAVCRWAAPSAAHPGRGPRPPRVAVPRGWRLTRGSIARHPRPPPRGWGPPTLGTARRPGSPPGAGVSAS